MIFIHRDILREHQIKTIRTNIIIIFTFKWAHTQTIESTVSGTVHVPHLADQVRQQYAVRSTACCASDSLFITTFKHA